MLLPLAVWSAEDARSFISLSGIGLVVASFAGIYLVLRIQAWYRDIDGPAGDDEMFLTALHESTREGSVTESEFRSIQSKLAAGLQSKAEGSGREGDASGDLPLADSLRLASEARLRDQSAETTDPMRSDAAAKADAQAKDRRDEKFGNGRTAGRAEDQPSL